MDKKVINFFKEIKNKKIAFCGIGTSNFPLIKMFLKYGAIVYACDRKQRDELNEAAEYLDSLGVKLVLGENYLENLDVDIVFRTPGMNYNLPALQKMRKNGIVITSEMEVFFELCPCKIIAVTGSDGKTTTTSIIAEILKESGKTVHLGGNIGNPLLPVIESIETDDIAVVELSSFQLISMRKSPDIAVITNVAPNHLDVHKDMDEYILSKKNIFLHQNAFSKTVINADNEITASFISEIRGDVLSFSRKQCVENGVWLDENNIMYCDHGNTVKIMDKNDIKIPGMHNVENYMAAICAVYGFTTVDCIKKVAQNFNGVEHRAEFVREIDGVKYYNDSIASSPTRTILGTLSLYNERIIIISGGYDKKIPFDELGDVICKKVKTLILLGATADKIEKAVVNSKNYNNNVLKIIRVKNMEEAVNVAKEVAISGDIVSLSPACASFDLYKNFDERGKHFKQIVNAI